MEEFEKKMEDFEKRYEREHNIFCPHCDFKQSEETKQDHVTYWADGDNKVCNCDDCDEEFQVKESVDRTFETRKMEGDA